MPRPMKPITLAIRKLLDQKGEDLTHADAAPLLAEIGKKEGFEVAENPGKSDDYAKMDAYELDWDDDANVTAVGEACGLSAAAVQRCKKEAVAIRAWKLQENQFNVTKNTWKKEQAGGVSKRPAITKNVRAKAASTEQKRGPGRPKVVKDSAPPKRRGRPARISMPSMDDLDEIAALKYVESHGGLPSVQELLVKAQAEAAYLQRVIELHANLRSRVDASGNVKKTAKSVA